MRLVNCIARVHAYLLNCNAEPSARPSDYWTDPIHGYAAMPMDLMKMDETAQAKQANKGSYRVKNGKGAVACTGSH